MTVEEAINQLANDPRGVAVVLQAEGIKGKKSHCRECPVAAYLDKYCGFDPSRLVKPFYVHYRKGDEAKTIYLPKAVDIFIMEFDCFGKYHELRA